MGIAEKPVLICRTGDFIARQYDRGVRLRLHSQNPDGIGARHHMRFNCRPEISVLELG